MLLRLTVLIQYRLVAGGRKDRRNDRHRTTSYTALA